MIKKIIILTIFIFSFSAFPAQNDCSQYSYFKPDTGPLANLNCSFHLDYDQNIQKIIASFGAPNGIPVILNLGGHLVFKFNGEKYTFDMTPIEYHQIKAFSHGVFATHIALHQQNEGSIDATIKEKIIDIRSNLLMSMNLIDNISLDFNDKNLLRLYAKNLLKFLDKLISQNKFSKQDLESFTTNNLPLLEKINEIAVRIALTNLNQKTNEWLSLLNNDDKAKPQLPLSF